AMGRKTTDTEKRYPSWKGEASAIVFRIRKYQHILSFKKFIINTDSSALRQLKSLKKTTGMLSRWTEELAAYDFEVIHRPGKLNVNVDALSQREDDKMPEPEAAEIAEQEYIGALDLANFNISRLRFHTGQTHDNHLRAVRWWVQTGQRPE
ncbi:MAG: hypothetical protein GY696_38875, partial [Gammaproteobacteria bacterium]|nr:hypothetical protein [Gammaproteobacteria bacterium]